MYDALRAEIEYLRTRGFNADADCLGLLLGDDEDARLVREWIATNTPLRAPKFAAIRYKSFSAEETEIYWFHNAFLHFHELDTWELASAAVRRGQASKIQRLASELANALEETPSPSWRPVIEYFDERTAVIISRRFPKSEARLLLGGTGYSVDSNSAFERVESPQVTNPEGKPIWGSVQRNLSKSVSMSDPLMMPTLLRRLADHAGTVCKQEKRDSRPNLKGNNERAFAREIAQYILMRFGEIPYTVIASCVALKFPQTELEGVDAETVRKWLRSG